MDDGTGCLNCTVWRHKKIPKPDNSFYTDHEQQGTIQNKDNNELYAVCDQLFKMCTVSQLNLIQNFNRGLEIGQTVQLKGRLKWFRQQIKLSAYFCRKTFLSLFLHLFINMNILFIMLTL